MSCHCGSGPSDLNDRPTLPPIRDLFREELSQSPRPPQALTNSPSFSFSRLSVSDDEERTQTLAGVRRSSLNDFRRAERRASQTSLPGTPPDSSPLLRPRSSSNLPTLISSEADRSSMNHPLSRSFTSHHNHHKSRSSNDIAYHGSVPSGSAYYPSSGRSTPSDPHGFLPSHSPDMPFRRSSHSSSKAGSPYASRRNSRHSETEHIVRGESPEDQIIPHVAAGSSMMDRPMLENSVPGSSAKYECTYCGKGFNRPSSLKIHLNSHTGEKPFTCPFEGCGRSFSVLSNMRRHARVHTSVPRRTREGSSDDGSDEPSPSLTISSISPVTPAKISPATPSDDADATTPVARYSRRDSFASSLSSRSRSRSASPDDDNRPEKRFRY